MSIVRPFIMSIAGRPVVSHGAASGDSMLDAYPTGGEVERVSSYVLTPAAISAGSTITDISHYGDTIPIQHTAWNGLSSDDKLAFDWVFLQVGLNSIIPPFSIATWASEYQSFVDDVRADTKPSCKIIVSAMPPCRQRWIDVYGGTDGLTAQAMWEDANDALMGLVAYAITGVDARVDAHVALLSDWWYNLLPEFESSLNDHIHYNNAGRQIVAYDSWRPALTSLGF